VLWDGTSCCTVSLTELVAAIEEDRELKSYLITCSYIIKGSTSEE